MILRVRSAAIAVVFLLLFAASQVRPCTWAIGYFYQVTALKGQVVGTNVRGLPRWLRQSFARKHAKLTLYEYRWPRIGWSGMPLVRAVETDGDGKFNFGPVKTGHYTLMVGEDQSFDVEVKDLPDVTESITIDVSPVYPDCTGGHEFVVKWK